MTQSETEKPRANRGGDLCPAWCTQDHDRLLIEGKPEHGHMDGHYSDPLTGGARLPVKLMKSPGADREAGVVLEDYYKTACLALTGEQAERLAKILNDTYEWTDVELVICELRAAAAIARETA